MDPPNGALSLDIDDGDVATGIHHQGGSAVGISGRVVRRFPRPDRGLHPAVLSVGEDGTVAAATGHQEVAAGQHQCDMDLGGPHQRRRDLAAVDVQGEHAIRAPDVEPACIGVETGVVPIAIRRPDLVHHGVRRGIGRGYGLGQERGHQEKERAHAVLHCFPQGQTPLSRLRLASRSDCEGRESLLAPLGNRASGR